MHSYLQSNRTVIATVTVILNVNPPVNVAEGESYLVIHRWRTQFTSTWFKSPLPSPPLLQTRYSTWLKHLKTWNQPFLSFGTQVHPSVSLIARKIFLADFVTRQHLRQEELVDLSGLKDVDNFHGHSKRAITGFVPSYCLQSMFPPQHNAFSAPTRFSRSIHPKTYP